MFCLWEKEHLYPVFPVPANTTSSQVQNFMPSKSTTVKALWLFPSIHSFTLKLSTTKRLDRKNSISNYCKQEGKFSTGKPKHLCLICYSGTTTLVISRTPVTAMKANKDFVPLQIKHTINKKKKPSI